MNKLHLSQGQPVTRQTPTSHRFKMSWHSQHTSLDVLIRAGPTLNLEVGFRKEGREVPQRLGTVVVLLERCDDILGHLQDSVCVGFIAGNTPAQACAILGRRDDNVATGKNVHPLVIIPALTKPPALFTEEIAEPVVRAL